MQQPLRVVQYNPQALPASRNLSDVLQKFKGEGATVVSLTGTSQSLMQAHFDGSLDIVRSRREGYTVWQWPFGDGTTQKQGWTNKSCGVMLAVKTKRFPDRKIVRSWQPGSSLQGRAGAVRYKYTGLYDLCFIAMYCPLSARQADRDAQTALQKWLAALLDELPSRCTPILLLDGNFHVGLENVRGDWVEPPAGDCVGMWGAERESPNARAYLEIFNTHQLVLVNTYMQEGSGPTFFSSRGHSRVDYIVVPQGLLHRVRRCSTWRRTGHALQLANTGKNIDHVPVVVDLDVCLHFDAQTQQRHRYNRDALAVSWIRGDAKARQLASKVQDVIAHEEIRDILKVASQRADVDAYWTVINQAVLEVTIQVFPVLPVVQGVIERPHTTALRKAYRRLREDMRHCHDPELLTTLRDAAVKCKGDLAKSRHADFQHT
eukprot:3592777-Amphidinium_carterae.1